MSCLMLIALIASMNPYQDTDGVRVREPMVRLVRPVELPLHCGNGANIQACTTFVAQRLECECSSTEGGWRIDAHAQFIPVMFVTGPVWVRHENDHVADVRGRVESHLQNLAMRRFEAFDECQVAADRERNGFPELMNQFKLESNLAFHPQLASRMK